MLILKDSELAIDNMSKHRKESKCYMAGKLFSEADISQRLKEYELLKRLHEELEVERYIFSPIKSPVNDKSTLPTSKDIFKTDERELMESDVIFVDLTDEDPGVMMELGMVIHRDVKIYSYLSDIRINTAGNYEGINIPYGFNQFVIGGLEVYTGKVYASFEEALESYKQDILKRE